MKHHLLLLFSVLIMPLFGMQRTREEILSFELMDAIRDGNYNAAVNLVNANSSLQADLKKYYNYTSKPILEYSGRTPQKTADYMKIARFLVNKGALINPDALAKLQAFERTQTSQMPISQPSSQPAPIYQQPIQKPAPAQPTVKPTPVVSPQPTAVPHSISKTTEEKYQNLLTAIGHNDNAKVKEIVTHLSPHELTATQQDNLFKGIDGQTVAVFSYEQLSTTKEILKTLLSKGFTPSPQYLKQRMDLILKNKGLGPRSDWIKPPLIEAMFKNNIQEAKRLIESGADVNETDSMGSSPLQIAIANSFKEIINLLLSKGASTAELPEYYKRELSKILGRTFN